MASAGPKIQLTSICTGQGKPCRIVADPDSNLALGWICKEYGTRHADGSVTQNKLWRVEATIDNREQEPPIDLQLHGSFREAVAFAKEWFAHGRHVVDWDATRQARVQRGYERW